MTTMTYKCDPCHVRMHFWCAKGKCSCACNAPEVTGQPDSAEAERTALARENVKLAAQLEQARGEVKEWIADRDSWFARYEDMRKQRDGLGASYDARTAECDRARQEAATYRAALEALREMVVRDLAILNPPAQETVTPEEGKP